MSINKKLGCLETLNSPVKCNKCNGNWFCVFKDGDEFLTFCLNHDCLQTDSKANIGIRAEERSKRTAKEIEKSGAESFRMGSMFKDACLTNWIATNDHKKLVRDWFHNSHPFLVVMGVPRAGKTYLSAAILNYFYDQRKDIFYTTHRRFIDRIKENIQDGEHEYKLIRQYTEKDILIFDDLGSATNTEWQKEMILELIDNRYSDCKKTLITTNFNALELKNHLGERTSSRILDKRNDLIEIWDITQR